MSSIAVAEPRCVDDVVAAEAIDDDAVGRLEAGDRHLGGQTRHRDHAVVVDDVIASLPLVRVDDDRVHLAVAGRRPAAARSMLTLLTSVPVRSLTVMVSAPPSASKSIVSTPLTSIVTLATSREKRSALAVGRDVDVLGDVGAVELQRVGAGLALDDVAAVARVPDERVVAGAEEGNVVAVAADARGRCRGCR